MGVQQNSAGTLNPKEALWTHYVRGNSCLCRCAGTSGCCESCFNMSMALSSDFSSATSCRVENHRDVGIPNMCLKEFSAHPTSTTLPRIPQIFIIITLYPIYILKLDSNKLQQADQYHIEDIQSRDFLMLRLQK